MSSFLASIQQMFADVELEREQMHEYQSDLALNFLKRNPFSALFIDMGLGKTVISASCIVDMIIEGHKGKILVIGPLRVMTDTWPTEFRRWRHLAAFRPLLLREDDDDPRIKAAAKIDRQRAAERGWDRETLVMEGYTEADIRKLLGPSEETRVREQIRGELAKSRSTIHLINREQLEWLVNFHGPRWPYRTVIIDESDSFKDYSSNRFKALQKVRQTPGLITRMHLMTATPDSEGIEEYFAQIWLLDLGERLGKNITNFRRSYLYEDRYKRKWLPRPGAEEEVLKKIEDICLVMKAKDYLKLEEPRIAPRYITLPPAAMALYEQMRDECVVSLEGRQIESETAAALTGKLQQIASGLLYETFMEGDWETEDMKKVKKVHRIHDLKIDYVREMKERIGKKPLIVVYHFKSTLDRLRQAFPKGVGINDKGYSQKNWDAGKIPFLFLHPASGGHGLNLQYGGHHMVIVDIPWPLRLYLQVIGRIARQGQKQLPIIDVLVAKGTVDEEAWGALRNKEDGQDRRRAILQRFIREFRRRQKLQAD